CPAWTGQRGHGDRPAQTSYAGDHAQQRIQHLHGPRIRPAVRQGGEHDGKPHGDGIMTAVALGSRKKHGKVWVGLIGTAALFAAWTLLSLTIFAQSGTLPTPLQVIVRLASDGLGFYWPNALITVREALLGYFWGVLCAILLGALVSIFPRAERPIMQ